MFSDDFALFTSDPHSLQTQLDCTNNYSKMWGLKINAKKTKLCIFERKNRNNCVWTIHNNPLEVVNNFAYLGIKFSSNGMFNDAIKALN